MSTSQSNTTTPAVTAVHDRLFVQGHQQIEKRQSLIALTLKKERESRHPLITEKAKKLVKVDEENVTLRLYNKAIAQKERLDKRIEEKLSTHELNEDGNPLFKPTINPISKKITKNRPKIPIGNVFCLSIHWFYFSCFSC